MVVAGASFHGMHLFQRISVTKLIINSYAESDLTNFNANFNIPLSQRKPHTSVNFYYNIMKPDAILFNRPLSQND